jgi:anaerobic selenocysteine-containing dehydrogenase
VNPGQVWEENEFWLELTWRIDRDGSLGIRKFAESRARPGERLSLDEYYGFIFEHSVPGLPERAAAEGLTPLQFMRRYGAFEVKSRVGPLHEDEVPQDDLEDVRQNAFGRVYTRVPRAPQPNIVPQPTPEPDAEGRRPVGVNVDGRILRGFPTPSGRLEFYSSTLARWGWPELALPTYVRSHVHPDHLEPGQMPLISTFRLPVQIHTRSANAKWLDEIAHTNPLWMHTSDAQRLGLRTGDLVRVETTIGYFVVKAWVTEGIRPGVVACSHHMGRWKLPDAVTGQGEVAATGQRQLMATVTLAHDDRSWRLSRQHGVRPFASSDADTQRLWWTDVGVHQNLTFPVHPDPVSGQHCWHQAVRVRKAEAGDRYGDISVDVWQAHDEYKAWLARTRPAHTVSPDGLRRPYWLLRPLKPGRDVYRLPVAPAGPTPP